MFILCELSELKIIPTLRSIWYKLNTLKWFPFNSRQTQIEMGVYILFKANLCPDFCLRFSGLIFRKLFIVYIHIKECLMFVYCFL